MKKADSHFPKNNGDHSDKFCCCGGHNHNNPKKNLHNHSTLQRFLHRLSRKYWRDRNYINAFDRQVI